MRTGKIVYLTNRLFGFIAVEDSRERIFFHRNDVLGGVVQWDGLNEGDLVEFEAVGADARGPRAINVRVTQRRLPDGQVEPRRPSLRDTEPEALPARQEATG